MQRIYNHIKDEHDDRDLFFGDIHQVIAKVDLPDKVDLATSSKMPPIWNQGDIGSCSVHAGCRAFQFEHGGGPYSRLQLYWLERSVEGTIDQDSGAQLRDCVKVLNSNGLILETEWPYITTKFKDTPPVLINEQNQNKLVTYSKLLNAADMKSCLTAGFPFIFGLQLFESFESDEVAKTGIVELPDMNQEQYLGGHAITCVGYDSNYQGKGLYYKVANSWGSDWGQAGYFYINAKYLENPEFCSDMWTMRS